MSAVEGVDVISKGFAVVLLAFGGWASARREWAKAAALFSLAAVLTN